ncbi:MAG: adenylyltransferase/cytidyltransferase family protein [Acidobacteria bacterium]|nr:adenylyltransferase/cytidyltransferase family protein [Acidobacteriota bacterium]
MQKIYPREQLSHLLEPHKEAGHQVGFANGCFDVLHVGHIRYLRDARAHCDILVVALNDDESVRRLKGPQRPLIPLAERMELVAALESVDFVTFFNEDTVEKTLRILKPDIQFKGTDYTPETVPERHVMAELGGKVMIAGDPKNHSTTELIEKMGETDE